MGSFSRHGRKRGLGFAILMGVVWIGRVGLLGFFLEDMVEERDLGFEVLKVVV